MMAAIQRESAVSRARGFTLIELVVGVAIVGILVAIAVPSYQAQLRKGRRAEAQAFITQVAQKEQQYLLDARAYAVGGTALADLSLSAPATVSNHYTVTVAAGATTPSFTITATATSSVQTADGNLTLTHTGAKTRMVGGTDKGW
jgi:type IV pilus assembly protein PilE